VRNKRILFITYWYPSEVNSTKGIFIKRHAQLLNEISELKVVHINITRSRKIYKRTIFSENKDLDLTEIRIESVFFKFIIYFIGLQKRLIKKAVSTSDGKLSDYDVVISNVIFPCGLAAGELIDDKKTKWIHIEHWSSARHYLTNNILKKRMLRVFNRINEFAVVSNFLKNELNDLIQQDIVVLPNYVDNEFLNHSERLERKINEVSFCAVANWRVPKRFDLILNSLLFLSKQKPELEITFNVIGEGEQLDALNETDVTFKINRLGYLGKEQLRDTLLKSDYFLHASDYETFSIVPLEAILSGLPVLVSKVGVLPEIMNNHIGYMVRNEQLEWNKAILELIYLPPIPIRDRERISEIFGKKEIIKKLQNLIY